MNLYRRESKKILTFLQNSNFWAKKQPESMNLYSRRLISWAAEKKVLISGGEIKNVGLRKAKNIHFEQNQFHNSWRDLEVWVRFQPQNGRSTN